MELFFNEEYATFWTAISSIMGVIATTMAVSLHCFTRCVHTIKLCRLFCNPPKNTIKFKDEFLNFIDKGNFQIA